MVSGVCEPGGDAGGSGGCAVSDDKLMDARLDVAGQSGRVRALEDTRKYLANLSGKAYAEGRDERAATLREASRLIGEKESRSREHLAFKMDREEALAEEEKRRLESAS